MIDDHELRRLASRQHALATIGQALATGLTFEDVRRLTDTGRWNRDCPRLLRLDGAPRTRRQTAMAAVLSAGAGSVLSHSSAVALYGVPGFTLLPAHVTHARDGVHRPARIGIVHDVKLLPSHHVVTVDDIPVVVPSRALFDVAGMLLRRPEKLERAIDNAWSMRLVSGPSLHARFDELARRGRPGIAAMRRLLSVRGRGYIPPASALERRFDSILADDGQAPMRRQVDLGDDDWIGRIDFVDDAAMVVAEVQSERFHTSLVDRRHDVSRRDRLEAAGFVVLDINEADIWQHPARVAAQVRAARRPARRAAA